MHMFGRLALVLAALLLLSACAGSGSGEDAKDFMVGGEGAAGTRDARPTSLDELQHYLSAELARLGKSVSATAASAPTGDSNAVFDLAASIVDPDGPPDGSGGGELPPTGIELAWTERLLGDYDMNGQVNVPDLVPLASHWLGAVAYDAAALHGGIAYWPAGEAEDDGGSAYPAPPAAGSGAANWRLARTDGDGNGQLYFGDVTTIAQHWKEQSSGYRVYVKLPGATAYQLLPQDGGAPAPPAPGVLTLARSAAYPTGATQPDPARPMRFHLSYGDEATPLPEGHYAFYVAAYDATSDAEGPACSAVEFDIAGGVMNQLPVARLSLSPNFAGAPAVISVDASASTDADGSIVEYRWDFDADGVVDWSTADASVPEKSSGGEVDSITPGAAPGPGLPPTSVTVSYERTAGYVNFIYPRVTVVDDKGGTDTVSAKLGVSGWEVAQVLRSTMAEYDPPVQPLALLRNTDFGFEPGTGNLAAVGSYQGGLTGHPEVKMYSIMFLRQTTPAEWEWEVICSIDTQLPDDFPGACFLPSLFWDSTGQPMVVMTAGYNDLSNTWDQTYLARRGVGGTWAIELLYAGSLMEPVNGYRGAHPVRIIQTANKDLILLEFNFLDKPHESEHDFDYQFVTFADGVASVEAAGWPEPTGPQTGLSGMTLGADGQPVLTMVNSLDDDPCAIWTRRRTASGMWLNERLDHGELLGMADYMRTRDPVLDANGQLNVLVQLIHGAIDGVGESSGIAIVSDAEVKWNKLHDFLSDSILDATRSDWGISVISSDFDGNAGPQKWHVYHDLVQPDGSVISERPFLVPAGASTSQNWAQIIKLLTGPDGQIYSVADLKGGANPEGSATLLMRRVDPRGHP